MDKRTRLLLALISLFAVLAAACGGGGGDDPAESEPAGASEPDEPVESDPAEPTDAAVDLTLVKEGFLTICTDSPYPPMEYEENGEFTGFDIELLRAVADKLGLDTEVVNSGFDPITSGTALASGQCDIAGASITITDEREESIDFTDSYFEAEQSLLVKTESGIDSLDAVEGNLGVQSGTTGEAYAQENFDGEIVSFDNPGDIFVALEAGEIDGVLQDLVVNQGRVLEDDSTAVVETYETDEQYGFAAEEGNTELTGAVNDVLGELREDGTYDSIYEEFFGSA